MRSVVLAGAVAASPGLERRGVAQKSGGVLKMYHRDNPPTLSIHESSTNSTVIPMMPLFNNLVVYDQQVAQNSPQSIVPDLAKSWSWSADGKALTFKLQEGVKWHDGKPFTAKDVVCTFDLLTGKAERQQAAHQPAQDLVQQRRQGHGQRRLRGDDPPQHPQPSLPSLLASGYSPIYPCHVPAAQMRTKPVGTGPFKFVAFKQNEGIKIERNPDYWKKGKPYLDGIEFTIVPNRGTAMLSFVSGRFDIVFPGK
jgi:peptide/nickel transport system substrate-binding protein